MGGSGGTQHHLRHPAQPCRGSLASSVSPIGFYASWSLRCFWPCHLRFLSLSPLRPASLSAGQTPPGVTFSTNLSASLSHLSRCPGHLLPLCCPSILASHPSQVSVSCRPWSPISTDNWSVSHVLRPQVPCSEPRQWVQVAFQSGKDWSLLGRGCCERGAKLGSLWRGGGRRGETEQAAGGSLFIWRGFDIIPGHALLKAQARAHACTHTQAGTQHSRHALSSLRWPCSHTPNPVSSQASRSRPPPATPKHRGTSTPEQQEPFDREGSLYTSTTHKKRRTNSPRLNPPAPRRPQPLPRTMEAAGGTAFWTRLFSRKKEKKIPFQHTTPEPCPSWGRNSRPPKPLCCLASMISFFPLSLYPA